MFSDDFGEYTPTHFFTYKDRTLSLDRRTRSKSKSGSSELPQNSLEDHSSMKPSILVASRGAGLPFFCMSKDHAQLLIMHTCIRNGNRTAGMNGATASERGGTEQNRHRFLTATVAAKISLCVHDNTDYLCTVYFNQGLALTCVLFLS